MLQLKWTPQYQFAGYYLAKELGYYAEAGIEVEIRPGGPGLDVTAEVLEQRAQFGISASNLLVDYVNGQPVVAIAAIFQRSPVRFVALKSSGIEQVSDLRNKRVMLLPGKGSFELLALLEQEGLLDKVERLDTSFDIHSLVKGETDLFNGYATNEPFILESESIPFNLIDPADSGIKFYADVLFTHRSLAAQSPDLVRRFTEASLKGWEYAIQHPDRAIDIMHHFAPQKSLSHLRFEALEMRDHLSDEMVPVGYMNEERWLAIAKLLQSIGMIDQRAEINLNRFMFQLEESGFDWERFGNYVFYSLLVLVLLIAWSVYNLWRKQKLESELEQTFELATHDPLTGAANRHLLIDRLSQVLNRVERSPQCPMIIFLDIDKFKALNDELGHQAGDDFLVAFVEILTKHSRPSDTVARIGGDEFVVLIDDIAHASSPEAICERIHTGICDKVRVEPYRSLGVGASIGAVVLDRAVGLAPDKLLALADAQMYAVKHNPGSAPSITYLSEVQHAGVFSKAESPERN